MDGGTVPTAMPPPASAGSHRGQQPQAPADEDIGQTSHRLYTDICSGGVGTASGRGGEQRIGLSPTVAAAPPSERDTPEAGEHPQLVLVKAVFLCWCWQRWKWGWRRRGR